MAIDKIQSESINLADNFAFTGTVTGASGVNTPAFQAYLDSDQSVSNGAYTKVTVAGESFDTAGCYNNTGSTVTLNGISTPSYSFAPNVAGKYSIYGKIYMGSSSNYDYRYGYVRINKNGSEVDWCMLNLDMGSNNGTEMTAVCTSVVDMNGTSDYLDLRGLIAVGSGTPSFKSGVFRTGFGAYKIIE
jgi:hypothetical protein